MKQNVLISAMEKIDKILGYGCFFLRKLIFSLYVLLLLLLKPSIGLSQSDGDYRSLKTGGGWGSSGTFEVYSEATDSWASTATAPSVTTNVTIMDGVFQTSNYGNWNTGNLTVGQGNAFSGTAILTGTAVTHVIINNPGALMANPGVTFIGAGTSAAVATPTYKMVGAYYRNKGTGYTTATVTIGGNTAWAASTAYTEGQQRSIRDTLYTVTVAGTSGTTGPIGSGQAIIDGSVTWRFSGKLAKAHATISGGQVTGIVIDEPGAGYVFTGVSLAGITITGDGTGASYAIQMGVDSIMITSGGNYTEAPQVIVGSVMMVGNATIARTGTVKGNLTFKNGANLVTGGGTTNLTQTLNIEGDLIAESPISFITVVPTSTSSTSVNFNKAAGTSTISGTGPITFNNLTIGATTALINNSTISIKGTTNYDNIVSFNLASPSVTGSVNTTNKTVTLTVPYGTFLTSLTPTISLRTGVTISPLSGVTQDFTDPVIYTVTALDGITTYNWTVTASVAPPSTDPTLTALSVTDNTLSPAFSSGTLTYDVILPPGTTIGTLPEVTYTTAPYATALKTDATSLPGATTIAVTAQDGTTSLTYTINFSIATGVKKLIESIVKLCPSRTSDIITIEVSQNFINSKVYIYNTIGKLQSVKVLNQTKCDFNLSGLSNGIYIVKIICKDGSSVVKQIAKH